MKNRVILAMAVLSFMACEQETCPEDAIEIKDSQGNFLNCFTPPKWNLPTGVNPTEILQIREFKRK